MNIALLVIDMQKAFFEGNSKASMLKAVDYINYAVELFRKIDKKVIWIQDEDEGDGNIRGKESFEIIDLLKPNENEKIFIKHYGNSFNKTGLMEFLINEKIDTIIITGYCAEHCVLSTYRGAKDHDFFPIILKNAIASGSNENIKFVENISEIISINVLEKLIEI